VAGDPVTLPEQPFEARRGPGEWGRALRPIHLLACLAFAASACGSPAAEWGHEDVRSVYSRALDALVKELGAAEELVVDPNPRFLVEDDDGMLRMEGFNSFGDFAFANAIRRDTAVVACRAQSDGGCSRDEHDGFATISEVLPAGPRDAAVLARYTEFEGATFTARDWVIQLRLRRGGWHVTRMTEGARIRGSPGW
jgi:hypothetical protein